MAQSTVERTFVGSDFMHFFLLLHLIMKEAERNNFKI